MLPWASSTRRTICARTVSPPVAVARYRSVPLLEFSVPPISLSPVVFSIGRLSPVSSDSSTADAPLVTTPSVAIFSPGRTRRVSPVCNLGDRDVALGTTGLDPPRHLGRERDHGAEGIGRVPPRPRFQVAAHQDERHDGRRRLEVNVRRHAAYGGEQLVQAEKIRRRRAPKRPACPWSPRRRGRSALQAPPKNERPKPKTTAAVRAAKGPIQSHRAVGTHSGHRDDENGQCQDGGPDQVRQRVGEEGRQEPAPL